MAKNRSVGDCCALPDKRRARSLVIAEVVRTCGRFLRTVLTVRVWHCTDLHRASNMVPIPSHTYPQSFQCPVSNFVMIDRHRGCRSSAEEISSVETRWRVIFCSCTHKDLFHFHLSIQVQYVLLQIGGDM